ncbi:MAG: lyase family protein, partial [Stagnimonas sp.]|nr:lyase family protein [Stagnimonas sp.]
MSNPPADKNQMWSGRFSESTSERVARFSESVSFDQRLWRADIAGSKAHARMLGRIGLLTAADVEAITSGLDAIAAEIEAGRFEWQTALEDVHMNIEAALTTRIGEAGKRLHTGRSRNDQVATDV